MSSSREYRLYTFVAGLYLNHLQKGLQTAHVVSELSQFKINTMERVAFDAWAMFDKTIIICDAGNHKGVVDCWAELSRINSALNLPAAIFYEDEQSMNGMATACGVIVPREYWDVKFVDNFVPPGEYGVEARPAYWVHTYEGASGAMRECRYDVTHPEGQFCSHIKQYRLTSA